MPLASIYVRQQQHEARKIKRNNPNQYYKSNSSFWRSHEQKRQRGRRISKPKSKSLLLSKGFIFFIILIALFSLLTLSQFYEELLHTQTLSFQIEKEEEKEGGGGFNYDNTITMTQQQRERLITTNVANNHDDSSTTSSAAIASTRSSSTTLASLILSKIKKATTIFDHTVTATSTTSTAATSNDTSDGSTSSSLAASLLSKKAEINKFYSLPNNDETQKQEQQSQSQNNNNNNNNKFHRIYNKQIPLNYKDSLHFHIRTKDTPNCGGCTVLYELYNVLKNRGYSTSEKVQKPYDCPTANDMGLNVNDGSKTIVYIYPEMDTDSCPSPLSAVASVIHVRWILAPIGNFVKAKDLQQSWNPTDLIFNYASHTSHPSAISNDNILMVITDPTENIPNNIPNDNNSRKNKVSWLLRKAYKFHNSNNIQPQQYIKENLKPSSMIEVGKNWAPIDIPSLGQYEYFLSYDPQTFFSYLAGMMGCISIIYPIHDVTKNEWTFGTFVGDYLKEHNMGSIPGIAYGWTPNEIQYANNTKHKLQLFMKNVQHWGNTITVDRFTRDCYRYISTAINPNEQKSSNFETALLAKDAFPDLYNTQK